MGKLIKETSYKFIENGICNFIASDAHSTTKRCTNLSVAMNEIQKDYVDVYNLVQENAENVLNNAEINRNMEKIQKRKGIFSFMHKK